MAGTGTPPKAPGVAARSKYPANHKSTKAILTEPDDDQIDIPPLPPRHILKIRDGQEVYVELSWHPQTLEWWVDLWASPMSSEYHSSDRHGLFRLACLIDNFWHRPNSDAHTEVRLAQKDYGLTPMDRRRLEWSIESAEEAKAKGDKRRQTASNAAKPPTQQEQDPEQDPRLRLVK